MAKRKIFFGKNFMPNVFDSFHLGEKPMSSNIKQKPFMIDSTRYATYRVIFLEDHARDIPL